MMKQKLIFLFLLVLFAFGCGESNPENKKEATKVLPKTKPTPLVVKDISWEEAVLLRENSEVIFLDVRTPGEVAAGTVKGSVAIPLQELTRRSMELPKDKKILVFCRSGNRSATASTILLNQGFKEVYNIEGGILKMPMGL